MNVRVPPSVAPYPSRAKGKALLTEANRPICDCTLKALEFKLAEDRGEITLVYPQPIDGQSTAEHTFVVTKFGSGQYVKTKIQTCTDFNRLFCDLVEYIIRYKYNNPHGKLPAQFFFAFCNASYTISDVRKELSKATKLPETAADLAAVWPGKLHTDETVPAFFARVWQKYKGLGLSMSLIKKLDPKFYSEISYLKKTEFKDRALPFVMQLPNQRSRLAELEEEYDRNGPDGLSDKDLMAVTRKKARDLIRTRSNRTSQAPKRPQGDRGPRPARHASRT